MALIDTYRNKVLSKEEEIAKIDVDIAKEQAKKAPLKKKMLSAESTIQKTKNQSTVKSKLNEIERSNKSLADIDKKIADLQKKATQKQKELTTAKKNLRNEEDREQKKQAKAEQNRQKELNRQMNSIADTIKKNTYRQDELEAELVHLTSLPHKITVLFMASNPISTGQLRLDEEARNIQEKIRMSEYRESLEFETRWATRASDVLQSINETNPTIVHFSGHGSDIGDLILENQDGSPKHVTKEAITTTMSTASDKIKLVVFNTCFSSEQARNIVQNIDSAIGMSDSIEDDAACVFAAQLYSSIGFGYSLRKAFDQAIAALMLEGISGEDIPKLFTRDGIDADMLYFVNCE